MASRTFQERHYSILKGVTHLFAAVNVGAGGAVTLQKWNYPQVNQTTSPARTYTAAPTTGGGNSWPQNTWQGAEGIFSVVRTGAGTWTVTLQDTYQRLLDISGFTARAGGLVTVADFAEDTSVSNYAPTNAPGSVLGIVMFNSSDLPGDAANGDQIRLHFELQNSTTP